MVRGDGIRCAGIADGRRQNAVNRASGNMNGHSLRGDTMKRESFRGRALGCVSACRRAVLLMLLLFMASLAPAAESVKLGVLSFTDKQDTLRQWSPTAAYLHQIIPTRTFEVVPLYYDEMNARVAGHQLDYVFTNSEHYVVLRNAFKLSAMLTLMNRVEGTDVNAFGGVIFSRAEGAPIDRLEDLRGKRVAAVGLFSLGGFLAAAEVCKQAHVDLQTDDVQLRFIGMPHASVVQAVLNNQADVGIVRTGVLEMLIRQGALDPARIHVVNSQSTALFPQRLSTNLYPEWPLAAMPESDMALTKAITIALLQMRPENPAARAGGYAGFTPPANYLPVEEVMRGLRVYPGVHAISVWQDLWEQNSAKLQVLGLVLLAAILLVTLYLYVSNRNLRRLTALYARAQEDLEIMAVAFNSQVGLIVTDRFTRIVRANDALCATLGYAETDLIGSDTVKLRGVNVDRGVMNHVWKQLHQQRQWRGELMCRHASGYDVPCMVTITSVRADRVGLSGFVGSFVDISAQKTTEAEIRQLAYFDQLTDLPNRRYFMERLESRLASRSALGTLGALLFIDLDHFKLLNDTHGHSVGDELLRLIAERLREMTTNGALAARLGGDEFVVMLAELGPDTEAATRSAMQFAQQVKEAILAPYHLNPLGANGDAQQKLRYSCSGSIGVALFGEVEEKITEVLKRADMAMYQAKQDGRNAIRQYDPSTQTLLNQRTALVSDLNLALSDTQFELYYQVQVDQNNRPLGAECLLRWNHPTRGQISPSLFIPLAEDCGAIAYIGNWVIRAACETLARWKHMPQFRHLHLSVNVSPKQFVEYDFVPRLVAAVAEFDVDTRLLILELTEGAVLQDVDDVIDKMARLRELGVCLSIDDFGTGYSSLSYLQRLPISEIKIDRSFVQGMSKDEESSAIVGAIIALADKLKFSVVAEGVETVEQQERLRALGATTLQGFLISRPCQLAQFERFVLA